MIAAGGVTGHLNIDADFVKPDKQFCFRKIATVGDTKNTIFHNIIKEALFCVRRFQRPINGQNCRQHNNIKRDEHIADK